MTLSAVQTIKVVVKVLQCRSGADHRVHNPDAGGSNPPIATNLVTT